MKEQLSISDYEVLVDFLKNLPKEAIDNSKFKDSFERLKLFTETEQHKSTHKENYENYWKAYTSNTKDLIQIFNRNFKHIYVNKSVENLFNIPALDIIGKDIKELSIFDEESLKIFKEKLAKTIETGDKISYYHNFGHQMSLYHTIFIPEFSEDNTVVDKVLSISREISSGSEDIVKKNHELEQNNEYMETFVYAAAHDLRSPVLNLKGLISLLDSSKDPEERKRFFDAIAQSVTRLEQTLSGLVEILKVQNEKEHQIKKISFQKVLDMVIAENENRSDVVNYNLNYNLDECKNITYVEAYILSILKNLISNSIKYRSPRRDLDIWIRTKKLPRHILLEVKDNGIGIDLVKFQNQLFRPFKRFTNSAEGKGIGLHIIKNMIEKNGGKIEVESTPDAGTTFYVYLKEYD